MRKPIAVFALLILIALVAVFHGKSGELPGVVDLTPSQKTGAPSSGTPGGTGVTPGGTGALAPVAPGAPAPSNASGVPSAREELIHSDDAKLVRGQGELGTINSHAQFVSSGGSRPLLAAAARMAVRAADCIRAGACAETPQENRAYFDPENTAAQRLLAQSLRLILDAANAGTLVDGIPVGEEKLFEIVRTGNEEARTLALELLLKGSPEGTGAGADLGRSRQAQAGLNPALFDRILAERDRFQGDSGRIFYSLVRESSAGSQVLHSHFMEALSDTWTNGDPETVLELVRHADELGFNEQEYAQSVSKLCRFAAPGSPKANWRAIRHHLENLRSQRGFQLGTSSICNA